MVTMKNLVFFILTIFILLFPILKSRYLLRGKEAWFLWSEEGCHFFEHVVGPIDKMGKVGRF